MASDQELPGRSARSIGGGSIPFTMQHAKLILPERMTTSIMLRLTEDDLTGCPGS